MLKVGNLAVFHPLRRRVQSSRHYSAITKRLEVLQDNPEPLVGLTGLIATAVGAYFLQDYWYPWYEGAVRFARSVSTAAIISFDYKYGREWMKREGVPKEEQDHILHQRSAERLLALFKKQGGIYVKAGQHMSSLWYLLPSEYCQIMTELHNKAMSKPFEAILPVLRNELGAPASEAFESLDSVPVAAASIAQVHRARYNGMDVAVKVQFPGIASQSVGDIRTIELITDFISWAFPEFQFKWLIREFDANLPLELDFTNEAANCNRTRALFEMDPRFTTPQIYHATKRVLIMEWIEGTHIDQVDKIRAMGLNPTEIAKDLNRCFSEQIFVHRFVHCDPHAGNVLVRKTKDARNPFQICLLDNGLYRDYTEDFCLDYAKLWMAILKQDEAELSRVAKRIGVSEHRLFASILTARTWEGVQRSLFAGVKKEELNHIKSQAAVRAAAITEVLAQVPSPLLLLLKTNDLLRSINVALGVPSLLVFSCTMHACQTALQSYQARYHPGLWWAASRLFERWNLSFKLFVLNMLILLGVLPNAI